MVKSAPDARLDGLVEVAQRRVHDPVVRQGLLLHVRFRRLVDDEGPVVQDGEGGVGQPLDEPAVRPCPEHVGVAQIPGDLRVARDGPQAVRHRRQRPVTPFPRVLEVPVIRVPRIVGHLRPRDPGIELHAAAAPRRTVLERLGAQEQPRTAEPVGCPMPAVVRTADQRLHGARRRQGPLPVWCIGVRHVQVGAGERRQEQQNGRKPVSTASHGRPPSVESPMVHGINR